MKVLSRSYPMYVETFQDFLVSTALGCVAFLAVPMFLHYTGATWVYVRLGFRLQRLRERLGGRGQGGGRGRGRPRGGAVHPGGFEDVSV